MNAYSRERPSPRYQALVALYRDIHVSGERVLEIPPEKTFAGQSLPRHATPIRDLIAELNASTVLDYGSGKGASYHHPISFPDGQRVESLTHYWSVAGVTCYDPGFGPFSRLPNGRFDGVICTDVLEHCPEEDLSWILEELFAFSRKFVYANVACYPARKTLPNGENAHCTIRPPAWWERLVIRTAERHPGIRYAFAFEIMRRGLFGRRTRTPVHLRGPKRQARR